MSLSIIQILQLTLFSILLTSGQVLFKHVAISTPPMTSLHSLFLLFTNIWFIVSIVVYASATLLWIYLLQSIELSLAYPFVALGFILIPLISLFLFKEPINYTYIIGVGFIIIGLSIILKSQTS